MKKQLSRALLVLAAALTLAVAADAQAYRAVVNVPFDFVAGERRLPAGRYTVRPVKSDAGTTLLIRSEDGRTSALVLTNAGDPQPRAAALVFRRHGDSYFLAGVSMPGAADVRELHKSSAERRLERELAEQKGGGDSKTVTVVGEVQ